MMIRRFHRLPQAKGQSSAGRMEPDGTRAGPFARESEPARPSPGSRRRLLRALALCLPALLLAGPAVAHWEKASDISFGTAYTLPERRLRIGVFAPMQYGVHDRVMLSTHPILDLLLAPNVTLQVRLLDAPLALSIAASYSQTFFVTENQATRGALRFFALASLPLSDVLILTLTGGVGRDLGDATLSLHGTLSAHVRFGVRDLLVLQGGASRRMETDATTTPSGYLFFAHAFESTRLGLGAAAGAPLTDSAICVMAGRTPFCPYLDIWWLF